MNQKTPPIGGVFFYPRAKKTKYNFPIWIFYLPDMDGLFSLLLKIVYPMQKGTGQREEMDHDFLWPDKRREIV